MRQAFHSPLEVPRRKSTKDALEPGEKVLLVDDLIATGGTAVAACNILRKAGAKIVGAAFIVCLPELKGDTRLAEMSVEPTYLTWFGGH